MTQAPHPYDEAAEKAWLDDMIQGYMHVTQALTLHVDELPAADRLLLNRQDSDVIACYVGHLHDDSATIFDALDAALAPHDLYPLLRANPMPDAPHKVIIADYRPAQPTQTERSSARLNVALFLLTVLSLLFTGATIANESVDVLNLLMLNNPAELIVTIGRELWRGWPYAVCMLLILGTHEAAHHVVLRWHGVDSSLPYFLPAPIISPFGTFGAAIALREPLKNRRWLLDVGISGPLAGFVVTLPILIFGYASSQTAPSALYGLTNGDSLLTWGVQQLLHGTLPPDVGLMVQRNQIAWAGWTGLFFTALNLIPLGQLDGGHVLLAAFGERSQGFFWPLVVIAVIVVLFISEVWLLFTLLLLIVGRSYAMPLDTLTPLDKRRRRLALIGLVIFLLSFALVPLYVIGRDPGLLSVSVGCVWLLQNPPLNKKPSGGG